MNFKIGDRVRLVRPVRRFHAVGLQGTVVSLKDWKQGTITKSGEPLLIDTDCEINWDDGTNGPAANWQLEPIQPKYDGNTMTEWEELTNLIGFDIREFNTEKA